MSDWLHNLPIFWMALVVFGFTYLLAAGICGLVTVLAKGERARAFKTISPGMLPPLGIIFGLFVSGRNCNAIDRGGIALSLWLAALCRGFRDVQSAQGNLKHQEAGR
jgi:hypothetical protein